MANRRMFSKDVIDTDSFINMPVTAQLLYIHLSMDADDEGFIRSPQKITRASGLDENDLKTLIANGYIILFDSGIALVTHWQISNYVPKDRKKETTFQAEKALVSLDSSKRYYILDCIQAVSEPVSNMDTNCIQAVSEPVSNMDTQVRLDQDSIDPPIPPKGGTPLEKSDPDEDTPEFTAFWKAYPRKDKKPVARRAFSKAIKKTTLETMLEAIAVQKNSRQWKEENGQFIPHPASWLNGECWNDGKDQTSNEPKKYKNRYSDPSTWSPTYRREREAEEKMRQEAIRLGNVTNPLEGIPKGVNPWDVYRERTRR